MANNPLLFNAALAGAFGGINTSRTLKADNPNVYVTPRNSAVAFAGAIDAGIPADPLVTQQHANLLSSICQQVLNGKGSAGFSSASITAIVTAYNLVKTSLEPVPDSDTSDIYSFDDDFDLGSSNNIVLSTSTTGTICPTGSGNWSCIAIQNSGNFQGGAGQDNHPGIFRFLTGSIANDAVSVTKNQQGKNTGSMFAENIDFIESVWQVQNVVTTTRIQVGCGVLNATFVPTSQLLEAKFDTSISPNILFTGGTSPAVNSGFAVAPLTFFKVKMVREASSCSFYINDVLAGTVPTVPTGLVSVGFYAQTLAAGQRFCNMDKYKLVSKALTR
jgi:hypothetical protein